VRGVVAVAGESGPEKSVVAAVLVRMLREEGTRPILVVDADPGMRLAGLLGVAAGMLISEMLDEVVRTESTSKEHLVEQRLQQECIVEGTGFDLITMGKAGGLEAHCYLRSVFHGVLARFKANYRAIVVDCDPDFEFMHGMGADDIDRLVVVSESEAEAGAMAERAAGLSVAIRRRILVRCGDAASGSAGGFQEAVGVSGIEALAGSPIMSGQLPTLCESLRDVLSG